MSDIRARVVAVSVVLLGAAAALMPTSAYAATTKAGKYANCTALHRTYPHGVARTGATDRVRGKTKPVTTFAVNDTVYNASKRLDADRDGVACEKR